MTKVDIISGFLGAGKTTFIKKLIEDVFPGERLVLIENEFGEIGIDGGFLKDAGVEITEMNSGCICCTLVGDFSKALQKVLVDYTPDRVIIEPSGVGKLSDVVKAIEGVKDEADIEIDGRITVVDGKKAKIYLKNFGEFFNNQVEHASTIVISRTQMMTDEKVEECVHMLREKNAEATIISTPWEELGKDAVLHALQHGAEIEGILEEHAHEHDDHEHHHHHDDECGCGHDHDHEHEDDTPSEPKPINNTTPLWMKKPSECTDEEYKEFYRNVFYEELSTFMDAFIQAQKIFPEDAPVGDYDEFNERDMKIAFMATGIERRSRAAMIEESEAGNEKTKTTGS